MSNKAFLTRQRFALFDIDGESFSIRKLTGAEKIAIGAQAETCAPLSNAEQTRIMNSLVLSLCLGDKNGIRIFSDEEAQESLNMPDELQRRIFDEYKKVNPQPSPDVIEAEKKS